MDSLLTAFLSSGHGTMCTNDVCQIETAFPEEWNFYNYFSQKDPIREKMNKKLRKSRKPSVKVATRASGEFKMAPGCLSFEIDVTPAVNIILEADEQNDWTDSSSLISYVSHQMYHKLAQKRVTQINFVESECCLTLGMINSLEKESKHSHAKNHHCCNTGMTVLMQPPCSCDLVSSPLTEVCNKHNLYFLDTDFQKSFSSWTIALSEIDYKSSQKNCTLNPLYEMNTDLNMNVSSDSFEVEFMDVDLCQTNCLQNLTFFYDNGSNFDDCHENDTESLVYETSDDEDDLCFDANVIEFDLDSSWCAANSMLERQSTSKYHSNCCQNSKIDTDLDINTDGSTKKKVRFAGKTIHHMVAWSHAYKKSRKSEWVKAANDRAHFQRKIQHISKTITPVLLKKIKKIQTSDGF